MSERVVLNRLGDVRRAGEIGAICWISSAPRDRQKIGQPVRFGAEDHESLAPALEMLLFGQALVHGHEHIEDAFPCVEEIAVVEIAPTHVGRRADLMSRQALTETPGYAGTRSQRATRPRLQQDFASLEHGDGMLVETRSGSR